MKQKRFNVTKEQQIKELVERIPPIVNVAIVIVKDGKYLFGRTNKNIRPAGYKVKWRFPGSRMRYTEAPQETAERIIKTETPGIKAHVRRIVTVLSDKGYDNRANGVTIFFLCDYVKGTPKKNEKMESFQWVNKDDVYKLNNIYELEVSIFEEVDTAIRSMHSNEDEILVEVNKNNKEIGSLNKREAHSSPKRYHRAAHIMIFNSKGEAMLQQRGLAVIRHPGKWDMPGGHQVSGQAIKQTANAELSEELGITTKLTLKRIGLMRDKGQSEFYYLFYGISDGPYGFDRGEVEQIKAFDCKKILSGNYDKKYKILPHVKTYVKELRRVWEPLMIKRKK